MGRINTVRTGKVRGKSRKKKSDGTMKVMIIDAAKKEIATEKSEFSGDESDASDTSCESVINKADSRKDEAIDIDEEPTIVAKAKKRSRFPCSSSSSSEGENKREEIVPSSDLKSDDGEELITGDSETKASKKRKKKKKQQRKPSDDVTAEKDVTHDQIEVSPEPIVVSPEPIVFGPSTSGTQPPTSNQGKKNSAGKPIHKNNNTNNNNSELKIETEFQNRTSNATKDILDFCFNENNKINKWTLRQLQDKLSAYTDIITELLIRNAALEGGIRELRQQTQSTPTLARQTHSAVQQTAASVCRSTLSPLSSSAWPSLRQPSRQLNGQPALPVTQPPASFASTLAQGRTPPQRGTPAIINKRIQEVRAPIYAIKISPTSTLNAQSHEQVLSVLKKSFDPVANGINITRMRNTRDNSIIIETSSASDLEKITKSAQLKKAGLSAEKTSGENPRLVIRGVPKDMTAEDVQSALNKQNLVNINNATARVCYKTGKRDAHSDNWVIEVSPVARNFLLTKGRLGVGWISCPVSDYIESPRCFKCQQFGHIAKFCEKTKDTCGHCATEGHNYKECTLREQPPVCTNCKKANRGNTAHASNSRACPLYQSRVEFRVARINYGQF